MPENNHSEIDWASIQADHILHILFERLAVCFQDSNYWDPHILTKDFMWRYSERGIRRILPMMKNACDELAAEKDFGHGYAIKVLPYFQYGDLNVRGLNLALVDANKQPVGAMTLMVGFPMHIVNIQGCKGNAAHLFYQATSRSFDEVLIDRAISAVGRNMVFERMDPLFGAPKIIFSFWADFKMPVSMKRRIAHHCLPKGASPMLSGFSRYDGNKLIVRPALFARARRMAERQGLPPVAKQQC